MALRYLTAGESHGPGLTAVVEGFPAGVPIDIAAINRDLARRMQGYGRGGRMKIERDEVELRAGVRWGESLGSPITFWIENRDWTNWQKKMSPHAVDRDPSLAVTRPRPGHADLAGALKYNHRDVRNVLERASARETAARVAVGGLAKCLLAPFGIRVHGWVAEIGGIAANHGALAVTEIAERAETSPLRMADPEAERRIIARIDECKKAGDTLGGVVETVAIGLPPGLGSHAQWDRKLDGRLAHALMSVQAAKGVEVGLGFETARRPGSMVPRPAGSSARRGGAATRAERPAAAASCRCCADGCSRRPASRSRPCSASSRRSSVTRSRARRRIRGSGLRESR